MIEGGIGGATTLTGLHFERKVDFRTLIKEIPGYDLRAIPGKVGFGIYFKSELVARCFRKHEFYGFLDEYKIKWQSLISKKAVTG